MRLLHSTTLELRQFPSSSDRPPYAILSHTWGPEEVTFQDITSPERAQKKGLAKIEGCCRQARADGLHWVWVDTCCIDKTSSAELSEAINSMYAWYRDSAVCYVYLKDVVKGDGFPLEDFLSARWFTRGWCLQELIAPRAVEFYATDWSEIGTKFSRCEDIERRTSIPRSVLLRQDLDQCSIAQKMSWASERQTTRIEDEAYCLLGLFGVHMPLLYGEGKRAFYRLQEELIKQSEDHSLLLWSGVPTHKTSWLPATRLPVFAPRPACFLRMGAITNRDHLLDYSAITPGFPVQDSAPSLNTSNGVPKLSLGPSRPSLVWSPPQITARGLRVSLPGTPIAEGYAMWTGCVHENNLVCVLLGPEDHSGPERYVRLPEHAGWPSVLLLDPVMLRSMKATEIYLSTSSTWLTNS